MGMSVEMRKGFACVLSFSGRYLLSAITRGFKRFVVCHVSLHHFLSCQTCSNQLPSKVCRDPDGFLEAGEW